MTEEIGPRTLIGWQGIRFSLPPEWNMTGFSLNKNDGYVKVDSTGSMFAQVRWTDPKQKNNSITLLGLLLSFFIKSNKQKKLAKGDTPDLRSILDEFLKAANKQAKKNKTSIDCKIKPEERYEDRVWHNFSWTGGGQGQGKIWYCKICGRVVMAQVVGAAKDPVNDVAAAMLGDFFDHDADGWYTWALYDLVTGIPSDFKLKNQKLMSGYLRLEFERNGGERILVERWGLANVTLKKFTIDEWFKHSCQTGAHRSVISQGIVQDHPAFFAHGKVHSLSGLFSAWRDTGFSLRPAIKYEASCWACEETNKIYAVQVWHNGFTEGLAKEVNLRCECH